jgi:hypothetical protein
MKEKLEFVEVASIGPLCRWRRDSFGRGFFLNGRERTKVEMESNALPWSNHVTIGFAWIWAFVGSIFVSLMKNITHLLHGNKTITGLRHTINGHTNGLS